VSEGKSVMEKDALAREAAGVLAQAQCLHTPAQVDAAIEVMAQSITRDLGEHNPLLLCVMIGGLVPTAALLNHFDFMLEVDYLHASRYQGQTSGAELHWLGRPQTPLQDRHVLIVDDILDEGITLAALKQWCEQQGCRSVRIAVLAEKMHRRNLAGVRADYVGLQVPDRYVFGAGMDYHGYLRNLRGIYAVAEEGTDD
jgi:hypoxanthine phosphoribosyltransferase